MDCVVLRLFTCGGLTISFLLYSLYRSSQRMDGDVTVRTERRVSDAVAHTLDARILTTSVTMEAAVSLALLIALEIHKTFVIAIMQQISTALSTLASIVKFPCQ